jgi:hypothetical protein
MAHYLKNILLFLFVGCTLFFALVPKTQAFDLFGRACKNDGTVNGGNGSASPVCQTSQGPESNSNTVIKVIRAAANVMAFVGGVAAVIVIIVSGLTFVTSSGNSEQVANARRRIVYSCVGLVIIALAWTITRFAIDNVIK